MIPFFVVDRPISLKIVNSYWATKPNLKYGLMTHALTSDNFRKLFANYPYGIANNETDRTGSRTVKNVIKMCDSGIFSTGRERITYERLFDRYDEMDADYGIMIDYLLDKEKTIDSAEEAVSLYEQGKYRFQLVLVAQGKTVDEYLDCYTKLSYLGIQHIAIGGLLRKKQNSARYVHLVDADLFESILSRIRNDFNPKWIFVLGVYHPSRHELMENYGVFGADYKGWIFNYKHRREQISELFQDIMGRMPRGSMEFLSGLIGEKELCEAELIEKRLALRKICSKAQRTKVKNDIKNQTKIIDDIDSKLLKLTLKNFHNDGLPDNVLEAYNKLVDLYKSSEREVRFAGVHDYFDKKILLKLQKGGLSE